MTCNGDCTRCSKSVTQVVTYKCTKPNITCTADCKLCQYAEIVKVKSVCFANKKGF